MLIIAIAKKFIYQMKIKIDGAVDEFNVPIYCPNRSKGCKSQKIKKNGHDPSVKGTPQWFLCKSCGKQFYAHTSGWFIDFQIQLETLLVQLFAGGHYNVKEIKATLQCSNATASRLLLQIVEAINNSPSTHRWWRAPTTAKVLFVDETFMHIAKTKYWLVVVVSEDRHVLAFELVKDRKKPTLQRIIQRAQKRLPTPIDILVTDGLNQYVGIAQEFGYDLIHVRHIHKPPFGRVIISTIQHTSTQINTVNAATYTNILDSPNMFYARITTLKKVKPKQQSHATAEKRVVEHPLHSLKKQKAKRGRPKGSKNRPKEVIEAEKREKLKRKGKRGRPKKVKPPREMKNRGKQDAPSHKKGSRGQKNYFKIGEYMVFLFNKKEGKVTPLWSANPVVAQSLEVCAKYFGGSTLTTNYVEQQFSTLKKLIDFRGKRTVKTWKAILRAYFTVRENPIILERVIHRLSPCSQIQTRWIRKRFCPSCFQKTILSEDLKEERVYLT